MRTLNSNELRAVNVAGDGGGNGGGNGGGDSNGGDFGGGPAEALGWWQAPSELDGVPEAAGPSLVATPALMPAPAHTHHHAPYQRLWWDDMAMEPSELAEAFE